jgi:hypothetical protein
MQLRKVISYTQCVTASDLILRSFTARIFHSLRNDVFCCCFGGSILPVFYFCMHGSVCTVYFQVNEKSNFLGSRVTDSASKSIELTGMKLGETWINLIYLL